MDQIFNFGRKYQESDMRESQLVYLQSQYENVRKSQNSHEKANNEKESMKDSQIK